MPKKSDLAAALSKVSGGTFLFLPGLFFVLMGVVALLAPRFILALVAGFFLFMGAVLCVVAVKVTQLQKRFARMAQQFEGRIVVHGVNVVPQTDIQVESAAKKIIYH